MTIKEAEAMAGSWICGNCGKPRMEHADTVWCGVRDQSLKFRRVTMPWAGMMRIKNESRWIAQVIESILPLCQRVFILDDHSTDNTVEICQRYSQVKVWRSPFKDFSEARDKDWLFDHILAACQPEWLLTIDGDEVLEKDGARKLQEFVAARPEVDCLSMQILYLWDSENQWRTDGVYGRFWRPSAFKPYNPTFRWMRTDAAGDLHCASVPWDFIGKGVRCPARIKHYGYIDRDLRLRKYQWYTSFDPNNQSEDCYRHMVQGDVPEIPAHLKLMHAGPLRLEMFAE